jgi:flagellar protein FliL
MTDKSESKSARFLPFATSMVAISAIGLGVGFGFSAFVLHSDPTSGATADRKAVIHELQLEQKATGKSTLQPISHPAESEGQPHETVTEEDEVVAGTEIIMIPFPPITTNLSEPKSVWVRLEGNLVIKKSAEERPEELAQSVAPRIMAFLRTTKLTDIQGANGLSALTSDLNEVVRSSSDGQIQAILLSGFIVE